MTDIHERLRSAGRTIVPPRMTEERAQRILDRAKAKHKARTYIANVTGWATLAVLGGMLLDVCTK